MNDYVVSNEAKSAILAKETLHFRIIQNNHIMDRIITPIGVSKDECNITLYSHVKKTYFDAAKDGIQSWTICETKEMQSTSTIGDAIYYLVETLEKMGYVFYQER